MALRISMSGTTDKISAAESGAMNAISKAPHASAIGSGSQFHGNGFHRPAFFEHFFG
jgi:hypothetical protein